MHFLKKRKPLWVTLSILLCLVLLLTIFGPHLVLLSARQPAVADSYAYSDYFFNTYDQVRENLQNRVTKLKDAGIAVQVSVYAIDEADGLYIDNLYLPANQENKNLIILTTGVHGMEGYIGSVMLDVFFEEIYPTLNQDTTGVLVVANVNPYGMKYKRRYNENNVDLNRNFIIEWE